jgi:hypothetical protein
MLAFGPLRPKTNEITRKVSLKSYNLEKPLFFNIYFLKAFFSPYLPGFGSFRAKTQEI